MNLDQQISFMEKLTELRNKNQFNSVVRAEAEFLSVFLPGVMQPHRKESSFVGETLRLPIGHFAQVGGQGLGYYCLPMVFEGYFNSATVTEEQKTRLKAILEFWQVNDTKYKIEQRAGEKLTRFMNMTNIDYGENHNEVVMPLYRFGGTQLNYPLLLELGIPGLINNIKDRVYDNALCESMQVVLNTLLTIIDNYIDGLTNSKQPLSPQNSLLLASLKVLRLGKPQTLHQAIQLILLYAQCTGSFNYGRLDDYLAEFYKSDKENENLSDEEIITYLIDFYDHIERDCAVTDGRFTVGGKGRRNPKTADCLTLLMMEAIRRRHKVLPQITLRFYDGQNPELMEKAFVLIGEGTTYPLLYNDDVNIPAVSKAFEISETDAINYLPYSCGEYILNHKSIGTPSVTLNVLKALEVTLFNGTEIMSGRKMGLESGGLSSFETFKEFLEAYKRQLECYIDASAEFQMLEYTVAGEENAFLLISMLMDNCIERSRPVLSGGVAYLGGSLECYGNTNVADSIAAIKNLIFDQHIISKNQLLDALKADFKGFEDIQKQLLNAPKYGNDIDYVDTIMVDLHEFLCEKIRCSGKRVGLDGFLPVLINNSYNSTFGLIVGASADGRNAGTYMANANNPAGGKDVSGITAMLNSLLKLSPDKHAGYVQNLKLSPGMFNEHLPKTKALLGTYFDQGGTQLMITVLNHKDLEDALINPSAHANLLVRVGGFTAKFIDLPGYVQKEIVSRTLY